MNQSPILQRLNPLVQDEFSKAQAYYCILSSLNNLFLTEREVQLIAFMVIKGNMLSLPIKEEFCIKFDSTLATISNMVSKLRKKHILVKDKNKTKVNPKIVLDFSRPVVLQISLSYES